ncbi:MAG: MaoC family dehydratase [Acidimicrobiales bacterium]|jgi:acyl dehydratase|nr:MaoC family dehydratase [Acidimicrobiales bacterium]MDP6911075.1 MaoC family dehydratase [Acidimicrobiales bacterium]
MGDGDERQVEHGVSGRWFEELPVGLVVRHALTRTITEADNLQFCLMTHNPQPLHLDAEFASGTEFGERLVNSLLTLGLVVGVSVGDTTLGTTVANLGFEETTFPVPVLIGDTLRFETEVVAARASGSRPDAGIVTFEHRAHNTRDEMVCRARRNALMRKHPA